MVEPHEKVAPMSRLGRALGDVGEYVRGRSAQLVGQAPETEDVSAEAIENPTASGLEDHEAAIIGYNAAFSLMNDRGVSLLHQLERTTDLIGHVEFLVNSIARTPKSFETDFEAIRIDKADFLGVEELARKDLEAARRSATGAGAGLTAGAAVAGIAPTAAMWVATTFGTASTGTAISTLSGAAASNAALAWLGGGAVAAGGGGTAAGSALLALAGPIGWTIVGATLLTSIALYTRKKIGNREEKREVLLAVQQNTALVRSLDAQVEGLCQRTTSLRQQLATNYEGALGCFGSDFLALSADEQSVLVRLVNNTKASAALLGERIGDHAGG